MQTLWLLGGLGLGAGLMYLMDSAKGRASGEDTRVRRGLWAPDQRPRGRYQADPEPAGAGGPRPAPQGCSDASRARGTAAHAGRPARVPLGVALVGGVGLGAGLVAARTPGGPPAAGLAARASACLLAHHGHQSRAPARAAQGMAHLSRSGHAARRRPHPAAGPGRSVVCRAGPLRESRAL